MSSTVPEELASLFSVQQIIILPISSLTVMYFVFGFYVFLFGTYLYMMHDHEKRLEDATTGNKLYLRLAAVLFILSTIHVVIYTIFDTDNSIAFFTTIKTGDLQILGRYLTPDTNLKRVVLSVLENLVPVFLNIVAEWMLIHRCYAMWGFDKRIGVPLIVASIAMNGMGLTSTLIILAALMKDVDKLYEQAVAVNAAYSLGSVVMNSILTLLTAGRIWWINRQVRARNVYTSDKFVQSVYMIIFESGILYPLFQIVGLIQINVTDAMIFPFDFFPIATLSAGIAPTLIMVRAKLGKNVENLETGEVVSDIHFNDRARPTTTTTGSQVQSHGVSLAENIVGVQGEEGKMV